MDQHARSTVISIYLTLQTDRESSALLVLVLVLSLSTVFYSSASSFSTVRPLSAPALAITAPLPSPPSPPGRPLPPSTPAIQAAGPLPRRCPPPRPLDHSTAAVPCRASTNTPARRAAVALVLVLVCLVHGRGRLVALARFSLYSPASLSPAGISPTADTTKSRVRQLAGATITPPMLMSIASGAPVHPLLVSSTTLQAV